MTEQEKRTSNKDIWKKEIDEIFIKRGLNPPERVIETGSFVTISHKPMNNSTKK